MESQGKSPQYATKGDDTLQVFAKQYSCVEVKGAPANCLLDTIIRSDLFMTGLLDTIIKSDLFMYWKLPN